MSNKCIAEKMHLSERTIGRIFSGEAPVDIDHLKALAQIFNVTLDDVLNNADFKVPIPETEALQNENTALKAKIKELTDNAALTQAEMVILKEKIAVLTAENDLLRIKLEYEQKIGAIHDFYTNRK